MFEKLYTTKMSADKKKLQKAHKDVLIDNATVDEILALIIKGEE